MLNFNPLIKSILNLFILYGRYSLYGLFVYYFLLFSAIVIQKYRKYDDICVTTSTNKILIFCISSILCVKIKMMYKVSFELTKLKKKIEMYKHTESYE